MSTFVATSSARSGFALGLSAGLVLASAYFLIRAEFTAPAEPAAKAPAAGASWAPPPTPSASGKAGSMAAAALALETRLAARGGPDDQWELLARSYEFLGRGAQAKLARDHRTSGTTDLRDTIGASVKLLDPAPRAAPQSPAPATAAGVAGDLLARAEQLRRARQFAPACAAYAEAARRGAMTAGAWADYADAQASLAGRLSGAPEKSIAAALAIDSRHTKALWLKASLQHEQHRYSDALATWRELLALVPAGSSDARIVQANIAEATRLAAG